MENLTLAVVQATPIAGNTPATIAKAVTLIDECGVLGANIIAFPEAFIGGYPKGADFEVCVGRRSEPGRQEFQTYFEAAIEVPSQHTRTLGLAAKRACAFVTIGVIERDGGTLYCTALYFDPNGNLLGKHRKTMPTGAERLCWGYGDGSTLAAVRTPWGPMGAVICWENYMPLLRMAMYKQQVAFYCAPTADDRDTWPATMQHVALEGRCFVLSACQYLRRRDVPEGIGNRISDDADHVLLRGGSMIVSPLGKVLAGPDYSGETILTASVDPNEIIRGKFDLDVVGHYSRSDIFQMRVVGESPRDAITAIGQG